MTKDMRSNATSIDPRTKNLEGKATELLRKAGFTWSGRPKSQVSKQQSSFERSLHINNTMRK